MKEINHANSNQKIAGVAILLDTTDFKTKFVTREQGHFIMITVSLQQEYITIISIYAPDRVPKYIKQKLAKWKEEIDNSTIIVGYFNIPVSILARRTEQSS